MISIIVCLRTRSPAKTLTDSIGKTIGVPYEIISIDNSTNKYGICEAYNLGIERSKYDNLCFMHDDIAYHSNDWGKVVLDHFSDEQVGAIGIAGTAYCAYMPGPWWATGSFYEHILQSSSTEANPALKSNIPAHEKVQVVVLDGVWFCIKKKLFKKIRFDDSIFSGFHLYDIDISMQMYSHGYKMYCVSDVLIHHKSMGAINNVWIENALVFKKKWDKILPVACEDISYNQRCRFEYKTLNAFIWICFTNGWSNKQIYALALKYLLKFKKGYLFYKTPGYLAKFLFKAAFKKGEPFYS